MGETHWRMQEGSGTSMGTRTGVGKAGNRTMLSTLPVNMAKPGLNTASFCQCFMKVLMYEKGLESLKKKKTSHQLKLLPPIERLQKRQELKQSISDRRGEYTGHYEKTDVFFEHVNLFYQYHNIQL